MEKLATVRELTSIQGCTFKQVWGNKALGTYGEERVYFIGLNDLIRSKEMSERKQDQVDLDILISAKERTSPRSDSEDEYPQ